ncbi:MAG: HlyD family efflux transporter periplasmic adaptor subunit, partial [Clostridiales bacterium]|nr:HlyD family efflux transporter periplasmic adaptor subunit [Clostridiales bacterium]
MAKFKPSLPKLGRKKAEKTVYQGDAAVAVKVRPKRKKWKIVLIVAIILVVLVAAAMIFLRGPLMMMFGRNAFSASDVTVSTVQSATAETGTLSSTISATGNLAMTDTEDVTIPSDLTVDEVYVESGDSVTEGQTLATLNTTSIVSALLDAEESLEDIEDQLDDDDDLSDLEIEELEGQQAELEELIAALEALHDNPVVTATCDGTISAIYVSDGSAASSSSSSSSSGSLYSTSASSTASAAPVLTLLTASDSSASDSSASSEDSSTSDSSADSNADSSADTSSTEDSSSTTVETITDFSELEIAIPVTGNVPQSDITETDAYTGTISWNCTSDVFKAETSYTATIVLTANDGYTFSSAELPTISGASYTWQIINEGDSGAKLRIVATFGATDADETDADETDTDSDTDATDVTDSTGTTSDISASESAGTTSGNSSGSISGGGSSGSVSGSVSSGTTSSGATDSSSTSGSNSSLYTSSDATAFTILKQDEVTISVSIDELDILSVSEGQTATVTLDALEDEEFTGTITSVGTEATSTSGNAKYTVEITIDKTDNMLSGMSASVVIQTGSTENAVLIPVAAL